MIDFLAVLPAVRRMWTRVDIMCCRRASNSRAKFACRSSRSLLVFVGLNDDPTVQALFGLHRRPLNERAVNLSLNLSINLSISKQK
ncbi:MAG: hypothetical protein ACI8W3_000530 [Myxococcota bacterium]|jgi:hypothetical protein